MNPRLITTGDLRASGWTTRHIAVAVAAGRLIRVRKGCFVGADTPPVLVRVASLGVRLDCVSLLKQLGVFVLEDAGLHVTAERTASRLPAREPGVTCHWRDGAAGLRDLTADVVEAIAQACRCQSPRAAIATLDSALHQRVILAEWLGDVFARLPSRYGALRPMLDERAESGAESLMRLLLRRLGCSFDVQVWIEAVGRVDFVVDGWLIIECDSEAHHGGWDAQRRDRQRDLTAATLGYTTIRPIAEDIFHHSDELQSALRRILSARAALISCRTSAPRRQVA